MIEDDFALVEIIGQYPDVEYVYIPRRHYMPWPPNIQHREVRPMPIKAIDDIEVEDPLSLNSASINPWYYNTLGLRSAWSMVDVIPNKNNREIVVAVIERGFNIDNVMINWQVNMIDMIYESTLKVDNPYTIVPQGRHLVESIVPAGRTSRGTFLPPD